MEQQDWQDGLGTATLYENLTRTVAQAVLAAAAELETVPSKRLRWPTTNSAPPAVPAALQPSGECPVCRSVRRTETYMIGVLVRLLEEDERLREQYQASFGLCLPHLVAALAACENHKTQRFLAEVQAGKLAHLADELADYERKHAVDHQHEPKGHEQTSWIRVIEQFVGKSE